MEIQTYYFALYSKALLEKNPDEGENVSIGLTEDYISSFLDNINFFEKRFYCAHVKQSTYENYDQEALSFLAKDTENDMNDENDITLDKGEWIEDLSESKIVCTHPDTGEEVDGIQYLEDNGLYYFLAETGITKFSSWCDKEDLQ